MDDTEADSRDEYNDADRSKIAEATRLLWEVLDELNTGQAALKLTRALATLDPGSATARHHLSLDLENVGEKAEAAKEELQAALTDTDAWLLSNACNALEQDDPRLAALWEAAGHFNRVDMEIYDSDTPGHDAVDTAHFYFRAAKQHERRGQQVRATYLARQAQLMYPSDEIADWLSNRPATNFTAEPSLSLDEAFRATCHFINQYYERERITPFFLMLHSMTMNPGGTGLRDTTDPATWDDWTKSVQNALASSDLPDFVAPERDK